MNVQTISKSVFCYFEVILGSILYLSSTLRVTAQFLQDTYSYGYLDSIDTE